MSNPADVFGFPMVDLPVSAAASPQEAVQFLVGQLVQSGRLPPEHAARVLGHILHREVLGSTGVGGGVAVPHAKTEVVDRVVGIVGRPTVPMRWPGAVDEEPVHCVCLLLAPASDPRQTLRMLETLSRQLRGG